MDLEVTTRMQLDEGLHFDYLSSLACADLRFKLHVEPGMDRAACAATISNLTCTDSLSSCIWIFEMDCAARAVTISIH